MDTDLHIIKTLVEWIWIPLGTAIVWTIMRLLGLERHLQREKTEADIQRAVISNNQSVFQDKLKVLDQKNGAEHADILRQLDNHHRAMTKRLDDILLTVRNGNGRRQA